MGCDIHTFVERRDEAGQWQVVDGLAPFDWRNYGMYGFLADVRNYSAVPSIAEERGLPDDISVEVRDEYALWIDDAHTASWLSVNELADFDYTQTVNDRRVTRQTGPNSWDGGVTGAPEEGTVKTYHELLGQAFLDDVEQLRSLGDPEDVRVVFWFDN